jgi:hypothetical protein
MGERKNIVICSFDKNSPRISAFEIHKWIHESLHLEERGMLSKKIDGQMRNDELNIQKLRTGLLYNFNGEGLKGNYEVIRAWTKNHSSR